MVNEFPQAQMPGEGGRQEQTGIGHQGGDRQRRYGYGRAGCVVASIGCSFSGTVLLLQNHYPRFRGAPSGHFRMLTKRPPSVDSGLDPSTLTHHQLPLNPAIGSDIFAGLLRYGWYTFAPPRGLMSLRP